MIDHVGINVSDYERSKAFYVEALAPLGYELGIELEGRSAGFVEQTELGRKPSFWLEATRTPVTENVHISFGGPLPADGRRVPRRGAGRRRNRQWPARRPGDLPPALLWRVRPRPRRQQRRGGMSPPRRPGRRGGTR